MADNPLGSHVQGCLDEGQPAASERPVLVAFKDPNGNVIVPETDQNGILFVNLSGGGPSVVLVQPFPNILQDHSGTIAVGGTAQTVTGNNATRQFLFIQNVSTGNLWINFGSAAVQAQPSIKLPPDAAFVLESSFECTQPVSIIGATTGQAYTCKEAG